MADRVVIMSRGEIAQVGAPRDIYRAPANRFVAEFVGRNNILVGSIASVNGSRVSIETGAGRFTVETKEQAGAVGSKAGFVIAADLVTLTVDAPADAENSLACTLISEEFIGSVVTLFLESKDGTEFKVQVQERELSQIDLKGTGQLHLSWSAANAHLLPDAS